MIKRIICVIVGILCLGFGISLTIYSTLGSDPLATFLINLGYLGNVNYTTAYLFVNFIFFLFMLIYIKDKVNIGTILALLLMGIFIDVFQNFLIGLPITEKVYESLTLKIVIVIIGILLSTLGVALYGESNLGLSPYDGCPLILSRLIKGFKFTYAKIGLDLLLVVLSLLLCFINKTLNNEYYLPRIITFVSFVVYGPLISFFSVLVNKIIFKNQKRILK